jgi:CRP/FNR family transcriptional regulator
MNEDAYFYPLILEDINNAWEPMLPRISPAVFPAKSVISRCRSSGNVEDRLFFIKKGLIRLSQIDYRGIEKIMLYMGKGTFFNENPVFNPYPCDDYYFTSIDETEAMMLPKKLVAGIIREHPRLAFDMMRSMSVKTYTFYRQLSSMRNRRSFGNTCRILYGMHRYQRKNGIIVPRISQRELAAYLGIHRSSLHKNLLRLKKENIIGRYSRRCLEIRGLRQLYTYAVEG